MLGLKACTTMPGSLIFILYLFYSYFGSQSIMAEKSLSRRVSIIVHTEVNSVHSKGSVEDTRRTHILSNLLLPVMPYLDRLTTHSQLLLWLGESSGTLVVSGNDRALCYFTVTSQCSPVVYFSGNLTLCFIFSYVFSWKLCTLEFSTIFWSIYRLS